jgi:hypothetical protein
MKNTIVLLNFKYDEVEPKILKILYKRKALDASSGISNEDLYTELNNTFHSYKIEDKPTFDRTRFYEIVYNLEEWDLIGTELASKNKDTKFYEKKKDKFKSIYLTNRGKFCAQQSLSTSEIDQFQRASLITIMLARQGVREMERSSGLGSVYPADKNYVKRLNRPGDKKEGITIEESMKKINNDSQKKISYDMMKAVFDLLEDKKIVVPFEIDGEKRFRIHIHYGPIISKIMQLFDATVNYLDAKMKVEPLNKEENKWYETMYEKPYFMKKYSDTYHARDTIQEFENTLIQSQLKKYKTCINDLEKQIEEIILNTSDDLRKYSTLLYQLLSINNQNKRIIGLRA